MDRNEWAEIVGDKGEVTDDLRWTLFQAERAITSMRGEDRTFDPKLNEAFHRKAWAARIALAALWTRTD